MLEREEIAKILFYAGVEENTVETLVNIADEILSIKIDNYTLKEIIEMIDKRELVKLAKDQKLPEPLDWHLVEHWDSYKVAQDDMLNEGYRRVEPLK